MFYSIVSYYKPALCEVDNRTLSVSYVRIEHVYSSVALHCEPGLSRLHNTLQGFLLHISGYQVIF